jgi:hypothetical protein
MDFRDFLNYAFYSLRVVAYVKVDVWSLLSSTD